MRNARRCVEHVPRRGTEDGYRLKAVTANGNMPAPMQPLNPASLGQLSGDDLVKLDNFNWPVPVVGRNRSFTTTASKLLSTPSCNQWIE
jgi:hypothetical protein